MLISLADARKNLEGMIHLIARFTLFTLKPETKEVAEQVGANVHRAAKEVEGIESFVLVADYAKNQYGSFVCWRSEEEMMKNEQVFGNIVAEQLASHFAEEPRTEFFEVFQPEN